MYPDAIVNPCREELTNIGIKELRTASDVDAVMGDPSGTTLVVVNSVCGCAAGAARPAVRIALQNDILPNHVTTVFAGVDLEAVDKARTYMAGYPPSSPSVALFKDGQIVYMLERHMIETRTPDQIADELKQAFNTHCGG